MSAAWVEALLKLQDADQRCRDMETRLSLMPQEVKELCAKRDAARASTEAAADKVRRISRAIASSEAGIADNQSRIQKLRQQSTMVKKNAEYQAMLNEIARLEKKTGELESAILENMDNLKLAKAEGRKIKAANDAVIASAKAEFDELMAFSDEVKKELASLKAKRSELVADTNRESYARYTALAKGKNDAPPLAKITGGICESCHMRVTQQTMVSAKKGEIVCCDNCQHLVYSEECIR